MDVDNTSSDRPSYVDWPTQLIYVNWFRQAIDYLEGEGCVSGSLVVETRKKINEAIELITAIVEGHDKDKLDRAGNLINEIRQAFFMMLDNCYNKYVGSRVK
jgi:hypothetical protein